MGISSFALSLGYQGSRQSSSHEISTRTIWKILGPFATASRRTPIHQVSLLSPLSHAACASMSTTTPTPTTTITTMTTHDKGDRYGPNHTFCLWDKQYCTISRLHAVWCLTALLPACQYASVDTVQTSSCLSDCSWSRSSSSSSSPKSIACCCCCCRGVPLLPWQHITVTWQLKHYNSHLLQKHTAIFWMVTMNKPFTYTHSLKYHTL